MREYNKNRLPEVWDNWSVFAAFIAFWIDEEYVIRPFTYLFPLCNRDRSIYIFLFEFLSVYIICEVWIYSSQLPKSDQDPKVYLHHCLPQLIRFHLWQPQHCSQFHPFPSKLDYKQVQRCLWQQRSSFEPVYIISKFVYIVIEQKSP